MENQNPTTDPRPQEADPRTEGVTEPDMYQETSDVNPENNVPDDDAADFLRPYPRPLSFFD